MAKEKAKSEKSCGLNVACHVNKWMAKKSQSRHDTIKKRVDEAESGVSSGS